MSGEGVGIMLYVPNSCDWLCCEPPRSGAATGAATAAGGAATMGARDAAGPFEALACATASRCGGAGCTRDG